VRREAPDVWTAVDPLARIAAEGMCHVCEPKNTGQVRGP
jgi:capsid protein